MRWRSLCTMPEMSRKLACMEFYNRINRIRMSPNFRRSSQVDWRPLSEVAMAGSPAKICLAASAALGTSFSEKQLKSQRVHVSVWYLYLGLRDFGAEVCSRMVLRPFWKWESAFMD